MAQQHRSEEAVTQPSAVEAKRFMGLDIHKAYFVATAVDAKQNKVYGPKRMANAKLEEWIVKELTPEDAVVLEMTTNTWHMVDALEPHVHSVTVVHPPHVKLITKAKVMNDKKASQALAMLHAAHLLPAVWVPSKEVRDLRALVAQRQKMSKLAVTAKCRLQNVLHREHIVPPEGVDLYSQAARSWWQELPLSTFERFRIGSDLDTLDFANAQLKSLTDCLGALAAQDERAHLLAHLPGFGKVVIMTVLAAIGDISRFPSAKHLVGYAGLGTKVHDSGNIQWSGRITKTGRKELRWVMVQAAHAARMSHPHWKAEYARLDKQIGSQKAIVAVARKLLVAVWHVLTKEEADRYIDPTFAARSFFRFAYKTGIRHFADGTTAPKFTRQQLDRIGVGADIQEIRYSAQNTYKLPPSTLDVTASGANAD
jgi:transposase